MARWMIAGIVTKFQVWAETRIKTKEWDKTAVPSSVNPPKRSRSSPSHLHIGHHDTVEIRHLKKREVVSNCEDFPSLEGPQSCSKGVTAARS